MSISLRLSEEEAILIKSYASINNISVSELVRQAVMEKIEDEYDLSLYEKAIKEYEADPVTYTIDEVENELGLK